jgi:predicted transcriptional regulator
MNKSKEQVKDHEEGLLDSAIYELYVRQKIAAGLKAADEGRLVPHEEVKRRFLHPCL